MADIELLIKISEDTYKDIIENGFIYDEDNEEVTDVIKNGTPFNKIRGEIQENIDYNRKMDYQGIVAGLLLTLKIIESARHSED